MNKPYDLIVFGATSFTGRLVADYLSTTYGAGSGVGSGLGRELGRGLGSTLRWAMAGRNLDKLAQVRSLIGAPATLPLLQADATDPAALAALVGQTRAVITTVGPYQRYGEALVTA